MVWVYELTGLVKGGKKDAPLRRANIVRQKKHYKHIGSFRKLIKFLLKC